MKLAPWNIRGMNKVHKHKEVKAFLRMKKVSIMAVMEHKIMDPYYRSKKEPMRKTKQHPWVCSRVMVVLEEEDRIVISIVIDAEIRDFANFLNETGLSEFKYIRAEFTWTNGHICRKLDRGLFNVE
ncbi:hypothetical protein HAX54_027653 [Datura stramonium]|uniref:Uncharacterized protein n=1 Tax=Datura stramonium TaxID=4076 RepID=A0ABS8S8X5_DATST|nr:hypothetical protein [Datura stramonium]